MVDKKEEIVILNEVGIYGELPYGDPTEKPLNEDDKSGNKK